jgi:hypothetical protein
MDEKSTLAQCASCPAEVNVPDSYSHGDVIKCGICGAANRIVRGDVLRLVLSDVAPLKAALSDLKQRRGRLEDELAGARGRLGIGVQGLYAGLIYVLYQLGLKDQTWSVGLLVWGLAISLVAAVVLEVLNYLFLSKHQSMQRLSDEIDSLRAEESEMRRKLHEAGRR